MGRTNYSTLTSLVEKWGNIFFIIIKNELWFSEPKKKNTFPLSCGVSSLIKEFFKQLSAKKKPLVSWDSGILNPKMLLFCNISRSQYWYGIQIWDFLGGNPILFYFFLLHYTIWGLLVPIGYNEALIWWYLGLWKDLVISWALERFLRYTHQIYSLVTDAPP